MAPVDYDDDDDLDDEDDDEEEQEEVVAKKTKKRAGGVAKKFKVCSDCHGWSERGFAIQNGILICSSSSTHRILASPSAP